MAKIEPARASSEQVVAIAHRGSRIGCRQDPSGCQPDRLSRAAHREWRQPGIACSICPAGNNDDNQPAAAAMCFLRFVEACAAAMPLKDSRDGTDRMARVRTYRSVRQSCMVEGKDPLPSDIGPKAGRTTALCARSDAREDRRGGTTAFLKDRGGRHVDMTSG